jgi:CBS domain-containing protein
LPPPALAAKLARGYERGSRVRVAEITSKPLIHVSRDTPVLEVARLMQERNVGAVGVVDDDGTLAGLITRETSSAPAAA